MREYLKKTENKSRTLDSNPNASKQMPVQDILQTYRSDSSGKQFIPCKESSTVQRKVGFEFQTVGGSRNVLKEKPGNIGKYESPGHAEVLKSGSGFSIVTDGSDLEYVIEASDDVVTLTNAVKSAADIHKGIASKKDLAGKEYTNPVVVDGLYGFYHHVNRKTIKKNYFINKDGEQTAHPQCTVGVKLIKLPDLIATLSRSEIGGTKLYYAASQKTVFTDVSRSISELTDTKDTPGVKGFIALLEQYIDTATKAKLITSKTAKLAKDRMPVMSRTSLLPLFKLLSPDEQTRVKAYFTSKYTNADTTLVAYERRGQVTLKSFMDGLTSNQDALYHKFNAASDLSESDPEELKRFGIDYPTQIDSRVAKTDTDATQKGALVEIRALERKVSPNDWEKLSRTVFNVIHHINSGTGTDVEKTIPKVSEITG